MEKTKKSVLLYGIIGFLLGLCLFLFMGAKTAPVGKYQVATQMWETHQYQITILDTQTGIAKMWQGQHSLVNRIYNFDYEEQE